MTIQTQYQINPGLGYLGTISRPEDHPILDYQQAQVPSAGRNIRPGDQVYWDATNNGVAAVTSDAQVELALGIATYFPGTIAKILSSVPAGSNSDTYVEYTDGQLVPFVVFGAVWVLAGANCEYSNLMRQQTVDRKWDPLTRPSTLATLINRGMECVSTSGSDGALVEVRVGCGRAL